MNALSAKDRLIIALDVKTMDELKYFVDTLRPQVELFKIGYEAFVSIGPQVIEQVHDMGGEVFLDLKFHDIPETMRRAARSCVGFRQVKMLSIHASADRKGIRAAVQNKDDSLVLGVTLLTSLSPAECLEVYGGTPKETVTRFAMRLAEEGADGVICSAREARFIKARSKLKKLILVTPGIRPRWYTEQDDQSRFTTPTEAILAGADYLVVGRPVRNPPQEIGSPADAVKRIIDEMEEALTKRGA